MSVTNPTRVSVVVLTYNGRDHVRECLQSLRGQTQDSYEVIVVDNASSDGTPDIVREEFPEAHLVCSPMNGGWCAGNNLGLTASKAPYAVLLNQDSVVEPDWLEQLVRALDQDPTIGAAQSKILLHDRPDRINTVGNGTNYLFFSWAGRSGELDDVEGPAYDVPSASGAALALRRQAVDAIGGLDDAFFLYNDDLDLCLRLRLAGHRVVCVPAAVAYHKYRPNLSPFKMYYLERNRLYMLRKYYPLRARLLLLPVRIPFELAILALSIKQGWFQAKLQSYGGAWRMNERAKHLRRQGGWSWRDTAKTLGTDFQANIATSSSTSGLAAKLLRGYGRLLGLRVSP